VTNWIPQYECYRRWIEQLHCQRKKHCGNCRRSHHLVPVSWETVTMLEKYFHFISPYQKMMASDQFRMQGVLLSRFTVAEWLCGYNAFDYTTQHNFTHAFDGHTRPLSAVQLPTWCDTAMTASKDAYVGRTWRHLLTHIARTDINYQRLFRFTSKRKNASFISYEQHIHYSAVYLPILLELLWHRIRPL